MNEKCEFKRKAYNGHNHKGTGLASEAESSPFAFRINLGFGGYFEEREGSRSSRKDRHHLTSTMLAMCL